MSRNWVILIASGALLVGGVAGFLVGLHWAGPGTVSVTPASDGKAGSRGLRPDEPIRRRPQDVARPADATDLAELADKLDAVERTMDRFYRGDPRGKAQATVNRLVDEHNRWIAARNAEHKAQRKRLEGRLADVQRLKAQIEELDRHLGRAKPDPTDENAVKAYNAIVSLRNSLVKEFGQLGKLYKADLETFQASMERSRGEVAARKGRMEAEKRRAEEEIAAYRQWLESDKDLAFSLHVNRLYARLHQETRRTGGSSELDAQVDRVGAVRLELGDYALRRQAEGKGKLIVVAAKLCRREKCVLIVDTGATCVAISPALVAALGLSDRVGEEIDVSLAGGVRIKAPKLVIPQLSVHGMEARDVKAVVLKEPKVGVDGLLGLSFLNRFAYRIDRDRDPKLILEPPSE